VHKVAFLFRAKKAVVFVRDSAPRSEILARLLWVSITEALIGDGKRGSPDPNLIARKPDNLSIRLSSASQDW
jgi:hypothetical protein